MNLLQKSILGLLLCLGVFSTFQAWQNTSLYSGQDLRNRLVGSRLLLESHENPYTYHWDTLHDVRWLDFEDKYQIPVNRVTVPPSVLWSFAWLNGADYPLVKWSWFAVQLACLLLLLGLSFLWTETRRGKWAVLSAVLFFIGITSAWQLHFERGQLYVLYPTLVGIAYFFMKKNNFWLAGVALALLFFLRPLFALFLLPIIIYNKNIKYIIFSISTTCVVLFVAYFFHVGNFEAWGQYRHALKYHSICQTLPDTVSLRPHFATHIPSSIESWEKLNTRFIPSENTALQYLSMRWLGQPLQVQHLQLLFLAFSLGLYFFGRKKGIISLENMFLMGYVWVMLSEYFLPAPRFSYNSVQWIFPLLLLANKCAINGKLLPQAALVLVGICLHSPFFEWLPLNITLGEGLIVCGFILTIANEKTT